MAGTLDLATVAAPIAAVVWLHQNNMDNALVWWAVIVGTSRPIRRLSDYMLDRYLSTNLNLWFKGVQKRVTTDFFAGQVLRPLRTQLQASEDQEDLNRIKELQRELSVLRR